MHNTPALEQNGYLSKTPLFQFTLLSCLFPLWAAAASLNDILITQFKAIFTLSDFASALVQSAFYGGYFLVAIPASLVIKKTSYKMAILIGLTFYIAGCSLFFPASYMATYKMFLVAIFCIAIGLSFLETAANTYSSLLGPEKYAVLRLNISQTFYPIGAIIGILLGKYLVFQSGKSLHKQVVNMSLDQFYVFRLQMLQHTLEPYKFIIYILIAITILFVITKFPSCKNRSARTNVEINTGDNASMLISKVEKCQGIYTALRYLIGNSRFMKGIFAQFLYVGMQVSVWSFTLRLALNINLNINERMASNYMVFSFAAFFVGRFIANFFMARFAPVKVLLVYAIIGSCLILYVVFMPNVTIIYAAILVSTLFGPCWPTIYAKNLAAIDSAYREIGGAIIIMSILGGAIIPAIHGYVSDITHSMQYAFIVPFLCFVYVAYYFYTETKKI